MAQMFANQMRKHRIRRFFFRSRLFFSWFAFILAALTHFVLCRNCARLIMFRKLYVPTRALAYDKTNENDFDEPFLIDMMQLIRLLSGNERLHFIVSRLHSDTSRRQLATTKKKWRGKIVRSEIDRAYEWTIFWLSEKMIRRCGRNDSINAVRNQLNVTIQENHWTNLIDSHFFLLHSALDFNRFTLFMRHFHCSIVTSHSMPTYVKSNR